jgi:tetratricopeptide (TPR) repeat protein
MRKLLRRLHHRVKLRGWIALVLLVAACVGLPALWNSSLVTQRRAAFLLKRAEAHLPSREFAQARTDFREALRLQPMDAVARRELADMEVSQGNVEVASLEYEALTELHPEEAAGYVALANLLVKGGQLEAPEALLDKAIEMDARRVDARLLRGDIRLRLGRYYGALQDARAAVASAPANAEACVLLVRATARSKGNAAGLEAAQKTISTVGATPQLLALRDGLSGSGPEADLGPPPALPRRQRADAQTGRGNLGAWTREHWPGRMAEARKAFEEALEKKDFAAAEKEVDAAGRSYSGAPFAPFLAGILSLARGEMAQAEAQFSHAMALSPRLPQTLAALGRTWALKRGPIYTAEQLQRVGTEDAGFSLARYMAARAFIEVRDPLRAEAVLRAGLKLQPASAVPYQQLTDYNFGLDRAAEALEVSRQGLDRFPDDIGLQMMLAQIAEGTGQAPAAIATYEALLAKRPDLDFARYKLANLLAAEPGDAAHVRFLAVLDDLRGDRPSDPSLLDALGWLTYKANDAAGARPLLEAAVKGAPEEPSLRYHLAMVYAQQGEMALAQQQLQAALDSPRPFPERIDAVRLLRQHDLPPGQKGQVK